MYLWPKKLPRIALFQNWQSQCIVNCSCFCHITVQLWQMDMPSSFLCLYPVKPRVPYRQHWEADFGDYFNIHSYSLRGADLVVALKLVLKACSSLSNFKTEVKCDKDLKETTTMSKSLFWNLRKNDKKKQSQKVQYNDYWLT